MSIPNPHDSLVQTVFSDLENAAGELRSVLPAAVVDKLNWTTLKLEPGTFVDPELRDRHTDLLYSVELKGSPKPGRGKRGSARRVFLYVLLEHQSSADRWMLLRLLRYMLRIWEWFLTNTPKAKRLPAIIPLVLNQPHLENRNFVAGDPEDLTPARSGAFTRSPSPSMGRGRCESAK